MHRHVPASDRSRARLASMVVEFPQTSLNKRMSVRVLVMSDTCDLLCLDLPKAETIRAQRLAEEVLDTAAARAKALADPTRLSVAAALRAADGELCVCDLAWIAE